MTGLRGAGQPRLPSGICILVRPHAAERSTSRRPRKRRQRPTEFDQQAIGLARVAPHAAGDAVLPGMFSAPALGHHVVNGFTTTPAVGTAPAITAQHTGPGDRRRCLIWHPHVAAQPDDRRNGNRQRRRPDQRCRRPFQHTLGLSSHHQHQRSTARHHGEGFVTGVEQQDPDQRDDTPRLTLTAVVTVRRANRRRTAAAMRGKIHRYLRTGRGPDSLTGRSPLEAEHPTADRSPRGRPKKHVVAVSRDAPSRHLIRAVLTTRITGPWAQNAQPARWRPPASSSRRWWPFSRRGGASP
jgi:hypothetical protein